MAPTVSGLDPLTIREGFFGACAFLAFVIALYSYLKRGSSKHALKTLATQLDGVVVGTSSTRKIEIPSQFGGPIELSYLLCQGELTNATVSEHQIPFWTTIIQVPVRLERKMRLDLVGQVPAHRVVGSVLFPFLPGSTGGHGSLNPIQSGDPEFEGQYLSFSDQAEEAVRMIEAVKPLVQSLPYGAFRLGPAPGYGKDRPYMFSAIFYGETTDYRSAQKLVLAISEIAAAMEEQCGGHALTSGLNSSLEEPGSSFRLDNPNL